MPSCGNWGDSHESCVLHGRACSRSDHRRITEGLQRKGIDVLTAQKDETTEWSDSELIDRATLLSRILVSHDADMLFESKFRQESGQLFSGVVYGHQLKLTIGKAVLDLELIANVMTAEEMANQVVRLPL